MKTMKRYITYLGLMKRWSLSDDELRDLSYGNNKVIVPYFKTAKRLLGGSREFIYTAIEFNDDPVYDDLGSNTVYNKFVIVFDEDDVDKYETKHNELACKKEILSDGAVFIESIYPPNSPSSSTLEADNPASVATACSNQNIPKRVPTLGEVKELKAAGWKNREIAKHYDDYFGDVCSRELTKNEWEVVKDRIKRFVRGEYRGNRR